MEEDDIRILVEGSRSVVSVIIEHKGEGGASFSSVHTLQVLGTNQDCRGIKISIRRLFSHVLRPRFMNMYKDQLENSVEQLVKLVLKRASESLLEPTFEEPTFEELMALASPPSEFEEL
jgi:hypothetical protein